MGMLRDNINRLIGTPKRDPDDIELAEFIKARLDEFDTAKRTIDENNRVADIHTTAEKEAE